MTPGPRGGAPSALAEIDSVIHGDCLDVLRRLPPGSVDAIVTDPPYGIDYTPKRTLGGRRWPKIANDGAPFIWFLPEAHRVLKDGGAMLCFVRFDVEADFRRGMELAGFAPKGQIIWDKVVHGTGDTRGNVAPQHENVIFAVKGRFAFPGGRPRSVLRHMRVAGGPARLHPTEKPVALMADLVGAVTAAGDVVLDPFAGSGPTVCAAKMLGRRYVGIELDKGYVDVARARLAATPGPRGAPEGGPDSAGRRRDGRGP